MQHKGNGLKAAMIEVFTRLSREHLIVSLGRASSERIQVA